MGKSGNLISDVIEIYDTEKLSRYLMRIDFDKAFDSTNHAFLIAALKIYGFGDNFIDWIKIWLKNQESCIINWGHTNKYFKLERGAHQGDLISTYLFNLALEIFFIIF